MASKWTPGTPTYKRAMFWVKNGAWNFEKAASIMGCTPEYLIERWGDLEKVRCPRTNRTYTETLDYIERMNVEAAALCKR